MDRRRGGAGWQREKKNDKVLSNIIFQKLAIFSCEKCTRNFGITFEFCRLDLGEKLTPSAFY